MASFLNVLYTIVALFKLFTVLLAEESYTNRCTKFGGDIKYGRCDCSRIQKGLELKMQTTILRRNKDYVKFETIER